MGYLVLLVNNIFFCNYTPNVMTMNNINIATTTNDLKKKCNEKKIKDYRVKKETGEGSEWTTHLWYLNNDIAFLDFF